MKRRMYFIAGQWLLAMALTWLPLVATTAIGLSSFEGIEEPLVRYLPATHTFVRDDFVNITEVGDDTFRMTLRYRSDVWDGDRDTPNTDRQRAEVKGLGAHQKTGETFDYSTTWRTNAGFHGANRFCHVFQLKSTDGDSGAPLVTISIDEGQARGSVRYWPGKARHATVVREFHWTPAAWQIVRLRIKTSMANDGEVLASVDGDPFQGVRGVAVYRPDATDYRPKWGLYRGMAAGLPLGDDYVEHKNISAEKVGAATTLENGSLEIAARKLAHDSPVKAVAWLQTQPSSPARAEAFAVVAAEWAQNDPVAAMAFVEKLAPAEGRIEAMQRVFNRWADQDAGAVLRWVAARVPAAELDPLLWYFATDTTLRYVAREKALAGAELIGNSGLRSRAIEHVVLIWARREPVEAAGYTAQSAGLSAAQKKELLDKIHADRK